MTNDKLDILSPQFHTVVLVQHKDKLIKSSAFHQPADDPSGVLR